MDPCTTGGKRTPARLWTLASWLSNQAGVRAGRLVAERLAEAGARKDHYAVLTAVADLGAGSQADVCRSISYDRSDVSALLDELERDGLVQRERDERDRRRNVVRLSAAGRARLRKLDRVVDGVQEELLAPLAEDEREQLRALLRRVVEHHTGADAKPSEPAAAKG